MGSGFCLTGYAFIAHLSADKQRRERKQYPRPDIQQHRAHHAFQFPRGKVSDIEQIKRGGHGAQRTYRAAYRRRKSALLFFGKHRRRFLHARKEQVQPGSRVGHRHLRLLRTQNALYNRRTQRGQPQPERPRNIAKAHSHYLAAVHVVYAHARACEVVGRVADAIRGYALRNQQRRQ